MLNVMHIVLSLNVGGLERFIIELTKNYSAEITPFIVCLEEAGELAGHVNDIKVIALNGKPGIKLGSVLKIRDLIRRHNIQLVHTHNEAAHFYGSLAGNLAGVPVVHTRHGRYLHDSKRRIFLDMLSSFLTTKIVGVSRDVSELIIKVEKTPEDKVLTFLNGVDVNHFHPSVDKANNYNDLKDPSKCIKIGIVARLDIVKDHSNLLIACSMLNKHFDNFRLIIVGEGQMRTQLEREVELLQINDKIEFRGSRNDIAEIMNDLDIFALSSTSEGISLTLLEAMACCLPVVATNVGGNPEVVKDGVTGYLVPPKAPDAFAEKLLILIHDSDLRDRMGQAGRERVMRYFSISQTAYQYEQLYKQVQKCHV